MAIKFINEDGLTYTKKGIEFSKKISEVCEPFIIEAINNDVSALEIRILLQDANELLVISRATSRIFEKKIAKIAKKAEK